jgi:hypothetical protein
MGVDIQRPNFEEFPFDARASTEAMLRFTAVSALFGVIAIIAAYAYGPLSREDVLLIGGFVLAATALFSINMWALGRGHAEVGNEGIRVKTLASWHFYRWSQISQMRAESFRALGWTNWLWATLTAMKPHRLVEVKLSRSIRQGFVSGRFSAEGFGFPLAFAKTVHIPVADPDRFVAAADKFISGNQSS